MVRPLLFAFAALSLAACGPTTEPEASAGEPALTVSGAEMRASLGRNPNTGGYLTVTNRGPAADRLVAAACACAERVELHAMSTEGGVMRMSQVDGFDVPADGALVLLPGGDHLMFLGLREPLTAGAEVMVALTFERTGEIQAPFTVVTQPGGNHAGHGG